MDADVYGPNIPACLGSSKNRLSSAGKSSRTLPMESGSCQLGFLVDRDAPAIWRGPIIMKIVQQFLRDVDWGDLDYFIVDLPPGTGDAQPRWSSPATSRRR